MGSILIATCSVPHPEQVRHNLRLRPTAQPALVFQSGVPAYLRSGRTSALAVRRVSGHQLYSLPVMLQELEGGRYEMLLMSDIDDAMTLELWEARPDDVNQATGEAILRVVRYNDTGRMDLSAFRYPLPVTLVELFIAAAREALPPKLQAV